MTRHDHPRVKQWLDKQTEYLNLYREKRPEYVQMNREAQRQRDRRKKIHLDIQDESSLVPLKSNMQALLDALGISRIEKVKWVVYDEVKDESGKVVEEEGMAGVGKVESWGSYTSC